MKHSANGISLYTPEQCQALDRHCIDDLGIDGYQLMQQAAQAAFTVLLSEWPQVQELIVLCGKGNNGGDGFEMAVLAQEHGLAVQLVFDGQVDELKGEALQAATAAQKSNIQVLSSKQVNWVRSNCVIVDALLGTGTQGAPRGKLVSLISQANKIGLPILALDVPSGLNGHTGYCEGVAIHATLTVTMLLNKQGLFTGQAKDVVGEVRLAQLGVPKSAKESLKPSSHLTNWHHASQWLPLRSATSHKGHFGHVLIIGGDHGMAGAVSLAASAALRSGAGLVSLATRPQHISAVIARQPEVMVHGVLSGQELAGLIEKADVIAIGPGLGQGSWGQQMLQQVMLSHKPLILDADALNLMAQGRIKHNLAQRVCIMTPHPGEAARLLQVSTADVEQDRFSALQTLSERFGCHVVLKGAGTLIGNHEHISICSDGNPGMATGGMGDVLTGIMAGMLAQHMQADLHSVMCSAVCLHSASADEAAKQGMNSLLASDLLVELRQLLN